MKPFFDLTGWLEAQANMPQYVNKYLSALILIALAVLAAVVTDKVIYPIVAKIIKKNRMRWDDIFLENNVFKLLSHIVPAIVVYLLAPVLLIEYQVLIKRISLTYIFVISALVIGSLLDSINEIYKSYPIAKTRPIKGLVQVVKITLYIIMGIVIVANLLGENPIIMLSSIGALTALLSLIFKDPILGFVAGIQLTGNDMLRIGDRIEMPKYDADGEVIELTMTTIKVRNFDKTIVYIPAYALVSDSFKNWRGITEAGGRRIKRSIGIDLNTVRFCTPDMIEKYRKIDLLRDYITSKEAEIEQHNSERNADTDVMVNGRRLTNLGTFRAYIENYLRSNPDIHRSLPLIVRQLPPTEHGIALEIYAFTTSIDWGEYEKIQSDIFDHIIAAAAEFDLRIYQLPSGNDLRNICLSGSNDSSKPTV